MCNFRDPNLVTFYLCIYFTLNEEHFTFHLQYKHSGTFANRKYEELSYPKTQKMCDPILVTLLKMRPHYSPCSRENATPSSGTSPLASYKEEPPPSRGRSTNSIAWKCWLLWNEWLLKWSKKRTILMRKKLRGLLEIWIGDRGSRIGFFNKNKIHKSWIVVRMWAADCRQISQNKTPFAVLSTINLSKLLRVWLSQWLFWRESEIFLENETLYPNDGYDQEIMSCSSCTALNIVLLDRVNTNCTEILNADAKQLWKLYW